MLDESCDDIADDSIWLSPGVIVGIVLAAIVLIGVLALILFFVVRTFLSDKSKTLSASNQPKQQEQVPLDQSNAVSASNQQEPQEQVALKSKPEEDHGKL